MSRSFVGNFWKPRQSRISASNSLGKPDVILQGLKSPDLTSAFLDRQDMAKLVYYWFTNTDLTSDDPRRELLAKLRRLQEGPGYNTDMNPESVRYHLGRR